MSSDKKSEEWYELADLAVSDDRTEFSEWFKRTGADAVLVRPDRFIYGAYTATEILPALIGLSDSAGGSAAGDTAASTTTVLPDASHVHVRQRPSYIPGLCLRYGCCLLFGPLAVLFYAVLILLLWLRFQNSSLANSDS